MSLNLLSSLNGKENHSYAKILKYKVKVNVQNIKKLATFNQINVVCVQGNF